MAPLFSQGMYLGAVGFWVALHILHGSQCVKAPDNPVAEGGSLLISPAQGTPRGQVLAWQEEGLGTV